MDSKLPEVARVTLINRDRDINFALKDNTRLVLIPTHKWSGEVKSVEEFRIAWGKSTLARVGFSSTGIPLVHFWSETIDRENVLGRIAAARAYVQNLDPPDNPVAERQQKYVKAALTALEQLFK